ncbi:MAG: hypothetical protein M3Q89_00935, partial [Verrucomicrobiota bacterium]|nr:hypothetical protein [Verrucomicrobiota bacterium]
NNVVKEGMPLPVEIIAVRPDGKPLEQPAQAKIRLTKISWQTNRLATAGGTSEFESKARLEVLWERELATVPGLGGDRKPNGAVLEQAMAGKPGEYLLEAIGKDGSGHDVLTSLVFEVSGEAGTDWNYRNPYAIDIVADKDSYEPGETATLMVKTPIAGDALVTVERERVLRSFVVPLKGNAPAVQVPIAETDGPNIFVSVLLLRGAEESPRKIRAPEYRIGYANLKVGQPKEKLTVQVTPAAPSFRPGEGSIRSGGARLERKAGCRRRTDALRGRRRCPQSDWLRNARSAGVLQSTARPRRFHESDVAHALT